MPAIKLRPIQDQMKREIDKLLGRDEGVLVIEAPTGTGKTYAYLLPVLETGCRAVVATYTNLLAERIARHDIPHLKRVLARQEVTVAQLKGRSNYLCMDRLDRAKTDPPGIDMRRLKRWAIGSATGDLAESPAGLAAAKYVGDYPNTCHRDDCHYRQTNRCFTDRARKQAAQADIVVTNMALVVSDIMQSDLAYEDRDLMVIDEAHHLPDVAANAMALVLKTVDSKWRLQQPFLHRLKHWAKAVDSVTMAQHELKNFVTDGETRVVEGSLPACSVAGRYLMELAAEVADFEASDALDALADVLRSDGESWLAIAEPGDGWVRVVWATKDPDPVASNYRQYPGAYLRQRLFTGRRVVCTSATLGGGSAKPMAWFMARAGVPGKTSVPICYASPFDPKNVCVYQPAKMPSVNHPSFYFVAASEIIELARRFGGRTFVLATNWTAVEKLGGIISDRCPLPLAMQQKDGSSSPAATLEQFKRDKGILIGVRSFWEGVDVPGEDLSCVVILQLPFGHPTADPAAVAESYVVEQSGGNPFLSLLLPRMVDIDLQQQKGRLARTPNDWGIVAVLDERAWTSRYRGHIERVWREHMRAATLAEVDRFIAWRRSAVRRAG